MNLPPHSRPYSIIYQENKGERWCVAPWATKGILRKLLDRRPFISIENRRINAVQPRTGLHWQRYCYMAFSHTDTAFGDCKDVACRVSTKYHFQPLVA
ncbi:MAG: hypothetical protein LBR48_08240 [Dysgonamonadaceae bacterium]|nr:hypothetical protein [Dysgonamonadaceae bacterium]